MILYHTTQKKNRGAIRRWGLIPRCTDQHNYPGITCQPVGVFGTPSSKYLFFCRRWDGPEEVETYRDVWRIDATGLPLKDDNLVSARVITCRVEPERLTLAGWIDFENEDWYGITGEQFWRKYADRRRFA